MEGRVLDSKSGAPIDGAIVAARGHKELSTQTDAQGRFHLERQTSVILAYGVLGDDIGGTYWRYEIEVSALGFTSVAISAPDHHVAYDRKAASYMLGDILLNRSTN
jgi:hypothetical protein